MSFFRLRAMMFLAGVVSVAAALPPARAQGQQRSLGDLARRAREQKKQERNPARVWTNDNLPAAERADVNVVGPAPAETAHQAGEPAAASADSEGRDQEIKKKEAALKEAKEQLARAEKELNLLERDLDLHRQQFYSNPDHARDAHGKAQLDDLSRQIDTKQREVQQAKEKAASLERQLEELKRTSAPSKPMSPPAEK
jgi:chromosome segregation ATPase